MSTAKPSLQSASPPTADDVAAGVLPFHHHAVLLVGSRLPEGGLPAPTFAQFARTHCGIALPGDPTVDDFWTHAASHPDVVVVDRDAKLIKLADVAPIRDRAVFAPTQGSRRLFFVDACERLSVPSANALLKVLEEPPAPCLFLFTARSARNVLPTIASRCQRIAVQFRLPSEAGAPSALSLLEQEDAKALQEHFLSPHKNPLGWIVAKADSLGKKYDAALVGDACLQAALEAHRAQTLSIRQLRFLREDIRTWRAGLAYNPSNSLWLSRLLLRAKPTF